MPKGKETFHCKGCGHQPPLHVTQLSEKGSGKGKGKAQDNTPKKEDKKGVAKSDEAKKKWDKRERELLEKIKLLESNKVHEEDESKDSKDSEMAVDETAKLEVARLQAEVDELQGMSASVKAKLQATHAALLAQAQKDLDMAKEKQWASIPTPRRLEDTKAWQQRTAKKILKVQGELEKQEEQSKRILQEIEKSKQDIIDLEVVNVRALQQVAEIAAMLYTPTAAATEMATPAPMGEPQPGYITIALAEEKFYEYQRKLQADYEKATQAIQLEDTTSEVASEVGEQEDELVEDAAWSKVEKSKRKAILGKASTREKGLMVNRLKKGIGKISVTASPFKK